MTLWVEHGNIAYKARALDLSLLDRCLIAGGAFWFQLGKLLWPSDLMFVYPRWDINAGVWWQYLFPPASSFRLAVPAVMVPRAVGGSADLHFAVVAFAGFYFYLFLSLFICSRSLANTCLRASGSSRLAPVGLYCWPDDCKRWQALAGAWNHAAAGRSTVRSHLAAKPDVYRHRNVVSDDYRP